MLKTQQSSLVLVIAITTTAIMAVATTIQIQPAYSQAQQCITGFLGVTTCVTPGKDPSVTVNGVPTPTQPTHQDAGQLIGRQHGACAQVSLNQCTVIPP